jgi:hypothetical protein
MIFKSTYEEAKEKIICTKHAEHTLPTFVSLSTSLTEVRT